MVARLGGRTAAITAWFEADESGTTLSNIVEALADCLEEIRRGGDLEACLQRYPQYRAELKAVLELAMLIKPLPQDVVPSRAFREATKARIAGDRRGPRRGWASRGPSQPG